MTTLVRLAERFVVLRETDDECRLMSAFESLRVKTDNGNAGLLAQVLPLLRDGVSEQQLRDAVDADSAADLDVLLGELLDRGLVERVEPHEHASELAIDGPIAAQVRYLANFLPLTAGPPAPGRFPHASGSEIQARIAQATIALVGDGDLAARVAAQLRRAGAASPSMPDAGPQAREELESAVRDSDLVVVCPDLHSVSLLRDVNRLCIDAERTWTSVRTIGSRVEVGPTIVPGDTACFACYEQRRVSNDPAYREGAERAERLALEGLDTGRLAIEAADGIVAAEVLKIVGGFSRPMTYGALFSLDLVTLESGLHPVLKIPRCAGCGAPARNRPTTSVWPFTP